MSKRLSKLQSDWESLAQEDPLWAILSARDKRGRRWDPEEFFASGEQEIAESLAYAEQVQPALKHESALDFGCGVGRLTQALARRFERVVGVDISPTMVELAQQYDHPDGCCEFVLNPEPHLRRFEDGSFDFIFSMITLQHIRPALTRVYLRELVRVLRPGGLLLFQLPTRRMHRRRPEQVLRDLAWPVVRRIQRRPEPRMEMHGMSSRRVVSILEAAGGRVVDTQQDDASGPNWESMRYAVTKGDLPDHSF